MYVKYLFLVSIVFGCLHCGTVRKEQSGIETYADVAVVEAMKNVMWKGELGGKIKLDTISNKKGLYGIGPLSELAGEILIMNGESYVSRVISDTSMLVEKNEQVSAPFFVYANVNQWNPVHLPSAVRTVKELEQWIETQSLEMKRPFAFRLEGRISKAHIHIQNLPKGTKVSSPKEAHQGQVTYRLAEEDVQIVGFFSTGHQGIFTHHDSYIHLHLITKDHTKMGHVDQLEMENMTVYFPVN